MKKASLFTIYLALWLISLFSVAILMTYVNDSLQASGFFGDTLRATPNPYGITDHKHDWGIRHYWYNMLCLLLFALSLVRIGMWCWYYWEEK